MAEIVLPAVTDTPLAWAIYYAQLGWPVFPCHGKVPAIPAVHRRGDPLRATCKGECGRLGHGFYDATLDRKLIEHLWWQYPGANIGTPMSNTRFALDIDPRNGGQETLAAWSAHSHAGPPAHGAGMALCEYVTTTGAEAGPAPLAHGDDAMTPAVQRRRTKPWDDSQPDLFIALPSDLPARDQQDLMERPFFSLAKNKRTIPIEYRVGENHICVTAPEAYGMATIWDADILIWAASQITEALSRGMKTSRFFRLSAYDLLKFTRRDTGGKGYKELKAALDRLQSTTVATNIRQGKRKEYHRFSWLNEWKEITDEQGHSLGIEFILPDWLYDGIINQRLVLSIDPAYFDLTSGIERWLYRVVRKHGGKQKTGWSFTFRQLYEKSGSLARFSDFAIDIRRITRRQSIPEYWLSVHRNAKDEEILHFIRRSYLPPGHKEATGIELHKRRTVPRLPMD